MPKYRQRVMIGDIASAVQKLFYDCASMNDWWIVRLAVMPETTSTCSLNCRQRTVAQTVKTFKGGGSLALRQAHPELEEWLWGDSFWAVGYFAESIGRVTENAIELYIENQKDQLSRPQQGSLGL